MMPNASILPEDADKRRAVWPVICYPNDTLPDVDLSLYRAARRDAVKTDEIMVSPRDAACYPLLIEVFAPQAGALDGWTPPPVNAYDRSHGRG